MAPGVDDIIARIDKTIDETMMIISIVILGTLVVPHKTQITFNFTQVQTYIYF